MGAGSGSGSGAVVVQPAIAPAANSAIRQPRARRLTPALVTDTTLPTKLTPGLYIVATPIGNLGDITARAAQVLAAADLIAAEDTRMTARLLAHLGLKRPMTPYHDHNADAVRPALVARLAGEAVALVSDAGTPLVSDPGFKLVRDARAAGHAVTTLPGPCAAIAALTLAGLPSDRFLFLGFLPAKRGARDSAIAEVAGVRATLVLYESAGRLPATLAALAAGLGERPAAVAREISKIYEETIEGTLGELARRFAERPARGEIVIVVAPPLPATEPTVDELDAALDAAPAGEPLKERAAAIARALGLPRRTVYARALARRGEA